MKPFRWDPDKNDRLKDARGISFEEIVLAIEEDTHYFLKTIIPSRKATRDYLGTEGADETA